MAENVKMTLGTALVLSEMVNMLLTKKITDSDGKERLIDREIPFRLKYRLTRNKATLDKDVAKFNEFRLLALAKYGEPTEDGQNVVINDPQKMQEFMAVLMEYLRIEVVHSVQKLDPKDFDEITDVISVPEDSIKVLLGYLVEDKEFLEDIATEIKFTPHKTEETKPIEEKIETPVEEKVEETKPIEEKVEKPVEEKVEETKAVEEKIETPVEEKVEKTPKKTTKKTTTKKTDTTGKTPKKTTQKTTKKETK